MVRFIRQGRKGAGSGGSSGRRSNYAESSGWQEGQRSNVTAGGGGGHVVSGNGGADMCRGGEMARGAAEVPD